MKKLLILPALLLSLNSFSHSGGMGNGGHPYEIDFLNTSKLILKELRSSNRSEFNQVNLYSLEMNIEMMKVELKRKKLKDKFGQLKCALNFPSKKLIQINKECWGKIENKDHLKYPLVIHELLGLSEEEVDHYKISTAFSELIFIQKKQKIEKMTEIVDPKSEVGQELMDDYGTKFTEMRSISPDAYALFVGLQIGKISGASHLALNEICKSIGMEFSLGYEKYSSRDSNCIRTLSFQNKKFELTKSYCGPDRFTAIKVMYCGNI